jgi:hypothetical protein
VQGQEQAAADVYDDGRLRVEHDNYYVSLEGRALKLPRKEFLLVSRLARNPERIVASEELWQHAWGRTRLSTRRACTCTSTACAAAPALRPPDRDDGQRRLPPAAGRGRDGHEGRALKTAAGPNLRRSSERGVPALSAVHIFFSLSSD